MLTMTRQSHFDLADRFEHLARRHPCLSMGGHGKLGRLHLPVSPTCNIRCRFCRQCFNTFEQRPGVSAGILSPSDALSVVERALAACPQITVVGVAGPGDALASDHALEALRLVHERFPDLIGCLSTNGLALSGKAHLLAPAGVRTLTVTINAMTEAVFEQVCSGIFVDGRWMEGPKAGRRMIEAQFSGIAAAVAEGLVVKINTVLIPGVNEGQTGLIARQTAAAGASLINVIPLIPQHELSDRPAPTCGEITAARKAVEQYLPVFRHCTHCRADACGVPGKDIDMGMHKAESTFSHG
jgi:nitrogen fixation protein NifB